MIEILRIEVIPSSKKDQIIEGKPLIVKVKEPPVRGKANKAVVELLSRYFGKRVKIVSGAKNKRKLIQVG